MLKSYFKSTLRNITKSKMHSLINITGLSVGMAVALLITLWIWDELSFDTYHEKYDRIAQVIENSAHNNEVHTSKVISWPLEAALRKDYPNDFKYIVMSSFTDQHVLSASGKNVLFSGNFIGEDAPEMLSLKMEKGQRNALQDASSILISSSVAKALFGDTEPVNQLIQMDNKAIFKVAGVYEDLPVNTTFHKVAFMAPWKFFAGNKDWIGRDPNDWNDNSLFLYVQLSDNADMQKVSEKIKNTKQQNGPPDAKQQSALFLHPMGQWHLYSKFENGVNVGGGIEYVWLFGIIGVFVLLLACINFMNLSTARSEKRAKEVGVRKAIGSLRSQLVTLFFFESVCMAFTALVFALFVVFISLPAFNVLASKKIAIPWDNPVLWVWVIGFTLVTGGLAGIYPALYLSSFKPVKALKGTFKAGKLATTPRKVLVTVQFAISVLLIICTIVVFKQIQFAKDRSVGYSRNGLINIEASTGDLHSHFEAIKDELLQNGAIVSMAESSSPTYGINNNRDDVEWKEKDPSQKYTFGSIRTTAEYGKTIGWKVAQGRDFNLQMPTDSDAVIINEAALKYMNLEDPIGHILQFRKRSNTIIGVVKDMVMSSPYEPAKPTLYYLGGRGFDNVIIRINPATSAHESIAKIEKVCKAYAPAVPFSFSFVDQEYQKKFSTEERIGNLATVFAILAIFISCIGLFGMTSFMAEQRVKEIGVRKVLGASVLDVWALLSKEFVVLVCLSFFIAMPGAYYFMDTWLQHYTYKTELAWWIFAATGIGTLLISLITVSFQSIKAALANPVKSLRTE
ncbi:ABC transporter permease [Cytophagaceae bacterium YF14B1]|uniref:ABC transporter permease n=1 Tax=Xanthocytophaga flava TaxID=3048013 RepID=A0AAE3QNB9_9BACT|nr:ABC transporter permease [Xanthocytophaga flavus]MDJ1480205.1 ABC transporter permease [Xanthocytophaga flavus]